MAAIDNASVPMINWSSFWLPPLVALASTAVLIWIFSPQAGRIGLVDHPDNRKHHVGSVPLVGGIAVFCGLLFGLMFLTVPMGEFRSWFAGAGALLLVGLLDDLHELSTRVRFGAQIAAALLMALWGGVYLSSFGELLGPGAFDLGWSAVPLTVFCAVGVVNAVNMIDGLDGLCGSLCLVCLAAIGLFAAAVGDWASLGFVTTLGAALVAFLGFNLRQPGDVPARVFLGDAGSMVLGFSLAWLLIGKSQGDQALFEPVTALWILAVPLMDTVFVMIRRMARGKSPTAPGRDHLHHLFEGAGFSAGDSLALIVATAAMLAVVGVIAELGGVPAWLRFYAFLAMCAAYYLALDRAWSMRRWLGRSIAVPGETDR